MGRYLPGHKDGGPLRTIINVTDALGDEYEFYIACLDRDHGDEKPYPNIKLGEWNTIGKAKVWYVPPHGFTKKLILELSKKVDLIYTCGFYDDYGYKTLLLKKTGKLKEKPVVVASMGSFSKGALAQKALKKKLFISLLKIFGLFKNITWSVTSELEANDLKRVISKKAKYIIAEDLPRSNVPGIGNRDLNEKSIVFLSRICPKKNLLGAIRAVSGLKIEAKFDIYGPKEDVDYWNICEVELNKLPNNINWQYKGDVPSEEVQCVLQKYNVFLFPTLGENYGHVIFEALSVGCVPIISDQTPWNVIQEKPAGYILPLSEDMYDYTETLSNYFFEPLEKKELLAENAIHIAMSKVESVKEDTGYRKIFK